jgi:hypothetical protein
MCTTERHEVRGGTSAGGVAEALPPAASRGVTLLVGAMLVLTERAGRVAWPGLVVAHPATVSASPASAAAPIRVDVCRRTRTA